MIAGFFIGIVAAASVLLIIAVINDGMDFDNEFTDWDTKTDKTYLTTYGKINIVVAVVVLGLSMFIGARIHIRIFESNSRAQRRLIQKQLKAMIFLGWKE